MRSDVLEPLWSRIGAPVCRFTSIRTNVHTVALIGPAEAQAWQKYRISWSGECLLLETRFAQ